MEKYPCVYILSNQPRGTLYVGVTSNLIKRVWEHKNGVGDGFTCEHIIDQLVWYEVHHEMISALKREKLLKKWKRLWKVMLIEKTNPEWRDLYPDLVW